MGTWGTGSFDNDNALDWADGFLASSRKPTLLRTTLAALRRKDPDYAEETIFRGVCEEAVAAAEVVATAAVDPTALPEGLKRYYPREGLRRPLRLTGSDRRLAASALRLVLRSPEFAGRRRERARQLLSRLGGRS